MLLGAWGSQAGPVAWEFGLLFWPPVRESERPGAWIWKGGHRWGHLGCVGTRALLGLCGCRDSELVLSTHWPPVCQLSGQSPRCPRPPQVFCGDKLACPWLSSGWGHGLPWKLSSAEL